MLGAITQGLYMGLGEALWDSDFTKLSFVNLLVLIVTSVWCGHKSWQIDRGLTPNIEFGWFMSDLVLTIGMIGTVIGFIEMLSGFAGINIEDISTIQDLITELGVGMSTALYTTLTGLISSALLKVQCFNIDDSEAK